MLAFLSLKKVQKSVSLNQEMWEKAILPVETFSSRKLTLRFLAEAANSLSKEVAANSTCCFAFTPKNKLCARQRHPKGTRAAGEDWRKVTVVSELL